MMALASNALTSVASLTAYMGRGMPTIDVLSVYHDESASATAATVQVTDTAVVLIITGGANAGTDTLTLSAAANDTAAELVAAINALTKGFVAQLRGAGGIDSTKLAVMPATSCFGAASEQYLRGLDTYAYEQAINAASNLLERWCNRTFASTDYVQAFHGTGRQLITLRQYPVTAVKRLCVGRQAALAIKNTSSDASDATVSNDGTNITLTIYGGANDSTASPDTVAISTNTIAQLATAIEAVGKNWDASVASTDIGTMLATELLKTPAVGCQNVNADLEIPERAEAQIHVDYQAGIVRRNIAREARPYPGFRPWGHYPTVLGSPEFPTGNFNVIVEYTAGYSSIPIDLEMLCNEAAASILRAGTRDSGLASETGGGYNYSATGELWTNEGFQKRLRIFKLEMPPEYMDV